MKNSAVTVIGTGKVGGALCRRLINKGVSIHPVSHSGYEKWLNSDSPIGEVLILAVKDDVLNKILIEIKTNKGPVLNGVTVLHVNGSLGRDVLAMLESDGAHIAAAHPFQTFAEDDPSALDDIGWGIDASEGAMSTVKALVSFTGGVPVRLSDTSDAGKRRYHAAAVAASNFAYASYELARQLAEDVGIDPHVFLVPIMQRTFENAADAIHDGEPFGITGPLVRGDLAAVEKQLRAMPDHLRPMYKHLSLALLEVESLQLSSETKLALQKVFA